MEGVWFEDCSENLGVYKGIEKVDGERGGIFGGHLDMHGDEVADGGEVSGQVGACE